MIEVSISSISWNYPLFLFDLFTLRPAGPKKAMKDIKIEYKNLSKIISNVPEPLLTTYLGKVKKFPPTKIGLILLPQKTKLTNLAKLF